MQALPDFSLGHIVLNISAQFDVNLSFLGAGLAKSLDADNETAYPQCDAYAEAEEALQAEFYVRAEPAIREVGSMRARATPDGFRQFVRDVRSAARALRDSSLRPKCPDRATASMRLHASYCCECCFAVVILGDKR